jgi:CCR4-NOT transcriptional regulation complex NOT5 subunit
VVVQDVKEQEEKPHSASTQQRIALGKKQKRRTEAGLFSRIPSLQDKATFTSELCRNPHSPMVNLSTSELPPPTTP